MGERITSRACLLEAEGETYMPERKAQMETIYTQMRSSHEGGPEPHKKA